MGAALRMDRFSYPRFERHVARCEDILYRYQRELRGTFDLRGKEKAVARERLVQEFRQGAFQADECTLAIASALYCAMIRSFEADVFAANSPVPPWRVELGLGLAWDLCHRELIEIRA